MNKPDSTPIPKLGLKQGDPIFLSNDEAQYQPEQKKEVEIKKCIHSERETCLNCIDKKKPKEVVKSEDEKLREKQGLTAKCNHSVGQKCLHCMQTPSYKGELKYNCLHGPNSKCPNCVNKEFIEDAKHRSFDYYLNSRKEKCKGTHDAETKCHNCLPPQELSFKMKPDCKFHRPYPEGLCPKCMPPSVILNRQIYRHVDYVSFFNFEELNLFVQEWQKGFCMKQRMGYLFGYFAKDPNYPDGVRAIVEALYEPPQLGDGTSVEALEDKDSEIVDRVAKGLTLECIGWIFTTISADKDTVIASYDVRKAAQYQEKFKVKHPSGYLVSKFISVIVKPKEDGDVELECFMVSDLLQALERDGVLGECTDRKEIPRREAKKNEMLPEIYAENKLTNKIDPVFCIVQVNTIKLDISWSSERET